MALGPDTVVENMQRVAEEAERKIDDIIMRQMATIQATNTNLSLIIDVEEMLPILTRQVWEALLRKKYILAGWTLAEWADPTNHFEHRTIKFTK